MAGFEFGLYIQPTTISDLTVINGDKTYTLQDFTLEGEWYYLYGKVGGGNYDFIISSTGYKTQTVTMIEGTGDPHIVLEKEEYYIDNIQTEDGKVYKLRTKTSELINDSGFVSNLSFYIVEMKLPTVDDPTWYKIYSNGWCEQGGIISVNYNQSTTTVSLLKNLSTYNILLTTGGIASGGVIVASWQNKTNSSFEIYGDYSDSTATDIPTTWRVEGILE